MNQRLYGHALAQRTLKIGFIQHFYN
ncbi:hypothetical protein QIA05_05960 (plasmid) [Borreliella burgdorferi]